jgi:hypothetical protein
MELQARIAEHNSDDQKFQISFIWIEENSNYISTGGAIR